MINLARTKWVASHEDHGPRKYWLPYITTIQDNLMPASRPGHLYYNASLPAEPRAKSSKLNC